MNAELERLLPDLAIFKYSIRNPARYDLQIDLVQCVLDRLIDLEKEVSLKRATEVLKEYFHKKRSGLSRTLYISPEKIRKIVFGLAKPFDKRTSEVGIINSSFHSIVKRMEKFAMTNECTLCWREEATKRFDTTVDFSYDRRGFLLNTSPVHFERIRTWWWDDRIKRGFIRTTKGREIVNRAGCLVRFLIYSQKNSKLEEYRYQLYTEIAERIGQAIRMSSKGIISSLTVAYHVFDSTPFFVDDGIIANVVLATKELQFLDQWTIGFVEENRKKSSKICVSSADDEYCSDANYSSDTRSERCLKNSLSPTSSRDSQYESLEL